MEEVRIMNEEESREKERAFGVGVTQAFLAVVMTCGAGLILTITLWMIDALIGGIGC